MEVLIETIKILVISALVVTFFSLIEKEKADRKARNLGYL